MERLSSAAGAAAKASGSVGARRILEILLGADDKKQIGTRPSAGMSQHKRLPRPEKMP